MASIYKPEKSKFWWGQCQINGKRHRKSLRTTVKSDAERRLKAWHDQLVDEAYYGIKRQTWQEAVTAFLEDNPRKVKPGAMKRYITSLRGVHDHFGGMFCDQIKRGDIIKFIGHRKRQGASNATINRDLTAISRVFAHAVTMEAIERNPCDLVSRRDITHEKREPIEPPSDADVARLVAACPPMLASLVRLLDATGMRLEEAASLEWRQIDSNRRVITLYTTKTSRPRAIDIDAESMAILSAIPRHIGCRWVFWHGDPPARYEWPSQALDRCKHKAGLAFRNHDLRHKHAIDWLKAGGDIYALSRRLGHSSVKTTEIYLAYISEEQRRSAEG